MSYFRKTFRRWWQKPRKASEQEEERSVSFLELFYDLSYVVIIAELTHALIKHLSIDALFGFISLFLMVWLAWTNGSYYHEVHGNNDIRTRVFTFAQMFALAGMAIFIPTAYENGSQGFALSYATFLLIITFLWWRTGVHDKEHAEVSGPYSATYLFTALAFIASAFIETPFNFYLWGTATVLSLITPLILIKVRGKKADSKYRELTQNMRPSLVERFGLFTIIMLGEVIFAVVSGAAHHEEVSWAFAFVVGLGLFIAIGMWWVYFDYVSHHMPRKNQACRFLWMYLHLPTTMSIVLTGAGVLLALEKSNGLLSPFETWFLVTPVSAFLICIALLIQTLDLKESHRVIHRKGSMVALVSAFAIFTLGFFQIQTPWLLALIGLFLIAPIFSAFKLWIRRLYKNEVQQA